MPLNSRAVSQNITTPADMGFRLNIAVDTDYSLSGKTSVFRLHSAVGGAAIYEINTDDDSSLIYHQDGTIFIDIPDDATDWAVTADTYYYYAIDIGITGETADYRIQGRIYVQPGEGSVRVRGIYNTSLTINDLTFTLNLPGSTTLSVSSFVDNDRLYFGTGSDTALYFDGTDFNTTTTASDFVITCGGDKTLKLGNPVWDDLRTPANAIRLGGAQPPSETAYRGGMVLAFPDNSNKTIFFNVQLPHRYQLGEDIEFHVHYALPTAGAGVGTENVKWDFTYSWADIGDSMPSETTATDTIDVQAKLADTHYLQEIAADMDGSGIAGVSSMLICSLTRDVSVADNYADDVYLLEVDIHFPIDTLGSRTEYVK